MQVQTLYTVLGVSRSAENSQIRAAYRHRALATHPDKGGSEEEFLKVVEAFEVLSDAQKRTTYDEELQRTGSQDGRAVDSEAAAAHADAFGLPDLGKTEPNAKVLEGYSALEEAKRAKSLWLELLERDAAERKAQVEQLSCRAAEVLLGYARLSAGGAPVVAVAQASECGALPPEEEVPCKRRRLESPSGPALGVGSRAHVCLEGLKVCTGASEDVTEAINWHILLVRVKQMYADLTGQGHSFESAVRRAIGAALEAEASDPRLRFLTECPVEEEVLFTPVTWDLDTALTQHQQLAVLQRQKASRFELLAAIRRMAQASQAAVEEQRALIEQLEQHIFLFRKMLRWRSGCRPKGVNASFCQVPLPSFWGEGKAQRPAFRAFAYAELWHQKAFGLEPLCRGPRRQREDEALRDLESLQASQSKGGDAAAKAEAKRLFEEQLRR